MVLTFYNRKVADYLNRYTSGASAVTTESDQDINSPILRKRQNSEPEDSGMSEVSSKPVLR